MLGLTDKRIWVAGHNGMVGSAVVRRLQRDHVGTILTADRGVVDLTRQSQVDTWMADQRPDIIVLAAAKVGGIHANDTYPADFLYDNLMIEANVIKAAADQKIEKLLFVGSSAMYPKMAAQPIEEEALLTGPLEATHQWYAVAKIAGLKLCQAYRKQHGHDFICAMPTNLYGPGDTYDLQNSHVIPALIRKAHDAKESGAERVVIWGSGRPRREFMYVDDLADALVFLLKSYGAAEPVNVGVGEDVPIGDLAEMICQVVGFEGQLVFDTSKPDGPPRKLMNSAKLMSMGWAAKTALEQGLRQTYAAFLDSK